MSMTEYEIRDLIINMANVATSILVVVMTIISAYLVVAWLVGEKLTRAQVTLVNLVFLAFAPMMLFTWAGIFVGTLRLQEKLHLINPETLIGLSSGGIAAVSITLLVLILGSIKFMWDVRHTKTE
jgi:hypothetical protein